MDWWNNLRGDYDKITATAKEERQPGIATLLKGILDSTSAMDRSFLDEAVLLSSPNLPEAFVSRLSGAALFDLDYIDEGVQLMKCAVAVDPTVDSKDYLAVRLQRIDRFEESHALYREMLNQEPESLNALTGVAQTYHQLDDLESSLAAYQKVVSLYPEYAKLRKGMASVLAGLGEYTQAMNEIEKLRTEGIVDDEIMLNTLAICYWYGMGNEQLALDYIDKSLDLEPGDSASLKLRQIILEAQKMG